MVFALTDRVGLDTFREVKRLSMDSQAALLGGFFFLVASVVLTYLGFYWSATFSVASVHSSYLAQPQSKDNHFIGYATYLEIG